MTTIAWDGKTMAADKRSIYGDCIQVVTKIFRAPDGCLVGGAGELSFILSMVQWVSNGRLSGDFPRAQADKDDWQPILVVEPGGRICVYERTPCATIWERDFCAIGSGKPFAMAAMFMGASAAEAVRVACEFDPGSGNGVDVLTLNR